MKKTRKGFTLVELLIVVAIIGVLAATMTMSSTGAVDAAGANNILNNLQTLRTAAMEIYTEESEAASATAITLAGAITPAMTDSSTAITLLAGYLGKKANAVSLGEGRGKYGLVGSESAWYVVYRLTSSDTAGVRTNLKTKATGADLYGSKAAPTTAGECGFSAYYQNQDGANAEEYVALKVR